MDESQNELARRRAKEQDCDVRTVCEFEFRRRSEQTPQWLSVNEYECPVSTCQLRLVTIQEGVDIVVANER
jgi:hypothetical protein